MEEAVKQADHIILGIDPGTNIMGYGILGVYGGKPRMIAMGLIELTKLGDHYLRLGRIYERVAMLVDQDCPDELAIEAPFFGKNVQSMLKLGRAQGVAMAAALSRQVPITEYEPRKIKLAITGNGAASKEQVCEMLKRILSIPQEALLPKLDATDALAAALCHFYESAKPIKTKSSGSWKDFIARNPDKIKKGL
ncbi:MAG: crossover junction endodeoxyribonuclease RuvC [Muribaculaceae bacterium]|nr:crossover junction endodeoxyribonuclease RuvC [Muribaculaceae bacterium]